jgi:hypothetical protein
MKITRKKAMLFSAVLLICAITAVTVFAQPLKIGHARQFVEPIIIGHGFALNGDQYHILDVNAVKLSNASPGFIRSLLSQKKTTDEIAKEINDAQMATNTRANLRFSGQSYSLNITSYDNQSLTGDVLTLPQRGTDQAGFTPVDVGKISILTSKYEGEMVSRGTLTMNGTDYKVLLTSPMNLKIGRERS